MRIKIWNTIVITTITCFILAGCASKGKPTPEGQMLTLEQVKELDKDASWNGKLVEIEGYPAFCKMMANVTLGKKSKMEIYTEAECKGDKLVDANLLFGGNTTRLSGEKERNFVSAEKNFDNNTLKFTTDDYQELPNGKFKFSGTLIYENDHYYLDNVTIHK